MDRDRPKTRWDSRMPDGLSFLMWPALVRAPWLIGSMLEPDLERREDAERRRRHRR
jgi:hypothetical protein